MREALRLLHERHPDLEVEGEMHADAAIWTDARRRIFPNSRLKDSANLLILPNLDAANIAFNLAKALGDGIGKPSQLGDRASIDVGLEDEGAQMGVNSHQVQSLATDDARDGIHGTVRF